VITTRQHVTECRLAASAADGALVRLARELGRLEEHSRRMEIDGLRDHVLCVLARLRKVTGGVG
jgi:hypothetical protein